MEKKNTDGLQQELMDSPDLEQFLSQNQEQFVNKSVSELLNHLFEKKYISKAALAKQSGMSEIYLHQIFAGRRNPSRNRLLCLCYGLGASVEETQKETIPHGTMEKSDPQQQAARTVEKGHDGYRVTVSRKVEWPDGRTLTDSFRSEYKAVPDVIIHGNPSVQPDKTARKQMTGTNVKQETEGTQKEKQKTVS